MIRSKKFGIARVVCYISLSYPPYIEVIINESSQLYRYNWLPLYSYYYLI